MIRQFIVSGAPGSGKTTTLKLLENTGYPIIEESARRILKEVDHKAISPEVLAQSFIDADESQYSSESTSELPRLFDRGILDSLCYSVSTGHLPEEEAINKSKLFPFLNPVFLFPPWEEIYHTDAERTQSYEESVIVFDRLSVWFKKLGYTTFILPKASIEERKCIMISEISKAEQSRSSNSSLRSS